MDTLLSKMRRNPKREAVSFETVLGMITSGVAPEEFRALLQQQEKGARATLLAHRDNGWTLFHTACQLGKLQIAFTLLEMGSEVNAMTPNGSTGIHFLALLGKEECTPAALYVQLLSELMKSGASVNQPNNYGETCLHMSCSRKNDIAVSFFVENGCDLNAANKQGDTPLHYAVTQNALNVVNILMEAGAQQDKQNGSQMTPLDLAYKAKQSDIIDAINSASIRKSSAMVQPLSPKVKADMKEKIVSWAPGEEDPFESGQDSEVQESLDLDVAGVWEVYRNEFFGKRLLVFVSSHNGTNALCVVVARPSSEGEYRGVVVHAGDWKLFNFSADQLLLYSSQTPDDSEQIRLVLAANKDTHLWNDILWRGCQNAHIVNGPYLLALESKLGLKPKICVGVVYGQAGQTKEADMFENTQASEGFLQFLCGLGEEVEIHKWKAFRGTFQAQEQQTAFYACWRGFEFVFHVSTLLDATKQRQHIGNDTALIYYLEGDEEMEQDFRGKVNAFGLVVRAHQGNESLKFGAFYRGWIEKFAPVLPKQSVSLTAQLAFIREIIFTNIINCTYWVGLSGLYKTNRTRLFDQAIGELITLEEGATGVAEEKENKKNELKESKKQPHQPQQAPEMKEIKSGWLLKRSTKKGKTSGWKKRYCVIREDGLSYYDKENMSHEERRGVVPFNTIRIVEIDLSVENTGKKGGEKACIVVFCDDGRYEFASTGDGQELKGWAQLLSSKARVELGEVRRDAASATPASTGAAASSASVLSPRSATPPPALQKAATGLLKKSVASVVEELTPEQMIQHVQPGLLFVAKKGLYKQDIFRNVGDQTEVEALAASWKCGQKIDWSSLEKCQVMNVAGAIRVYYRELPAQALLGEAQFQLLMEVNKKSDKVQKIDAASGVIQNPLLLLLFDLLAKVASNSRMNKMTASNLASVFAPTFLRSAEHDKDPTILLEHTKSVVASLDFIITHFVCCSLSSEVDAKWTHDEEDQAQKDVIVDREDEEEEVEEKPKRKELEFSDFRKEIKGKAKIDLDFVDDRRSRRADAETPPPEDKKKVADRKSDRDVPPEEPAPPPARLGRSFSSIAPAAPVSKNSPPPLPPGGRAKGKKGLPFKTPAPKPPAKGKTGEPEEEERKALPKPPSKTVFSAVAAEEDEDAPVHSSSSSSDNDEPAARRRAASPLNIDVEGFEESPRREVSTRAALPVTAGRGRGRGGEDLELARGRARGRAVELVPPEESDAQGRGRAGRVMRGSAARAAGAKTTKDDAEEDSPAKGNWRDRANKSLPNRRSKPPNASLLDDSDEDAAVVDEGRKVDIDELLHDSDEDAETRDIDVPQEIQEQAEEQPAKAEDEDRSPLVSPIELDELDVVKTPVRPSKKDPSARVKPAVVVEKQEEEANSDQEFETLEPMEDVFE